MNIILTIFKSRVAVKLVLGMSLLALSTLWAQSYKPMFDGTTLKGWHAMGAGSWKVVNGVIEGTHDGNEPWGHLVSDSNYNNFQIHYKWKLTGGGNSGMYFRSTPNLDPGMVGCQVEMDEEFSGGIYSTGTNPWRWIYQPSADSVKKWYLPLEWNDMVVTLQGKHVRIVENGTVTLDSTMEDLGDTGKIGWQLHYGKTMTISLKNLEWSPLPVTTSTLKLISNHQFSADRRRTFKNGSLGFKYAKSGFSYLSDGSKSQ